MVLLRADLTASNSTQFHLSQVKKNVSRQDFYKRRERARGFFCQLLFPIICFLYTSLPSPRDTLDLASNVFNILA